MQYKDIQGYIGSYQIAEGENGQPVVRSLPRKRKYRHGERTVPGATLKPSFDKDGYHLYQLKVDGRRRSFRAHRLFLEHFIGPCPEGWECDHINGDRTDNRLSNLRWVTKSMNRSRVKARNQHMPPSN